MKLTRAFRPLVALMLLVVSAQSAFAAAAPKEFLALDQTPAGAAIAAEGDAVRLGGTVQKLEVGMEAIDDAAGKDAAGNGSTFDVFVTFVENGQTSRILAGQIVMEAGHADLMLAVDPLERGCAPLACGQLPAGFGSVETISRVELVAGTILDPATKMSRPELAGQVVLDSAPNTWGPRAR